MNTVLSLLAIFAYLAGSILAGLAVRDPGHGRRPLSLLAGAAGAVIHAVLLIEELTVSARLDLNFFHALSLMSWTIVIVFMAAAMVRRVHGLGAFLYPLAALCLALAAFYPHQPAVFTGENWRLDLHIVVSVMAFSLLSVAALIAVLLAMQERALRLHKPMGFLNALPPLQTTEALLFQLIGGGFLLLTAALATGLMFVDNLMGQHLAHKTVLSIAAWIVFGVLLWGRLRHGWRGPKAVRWTLAAMALLLLAYFGTKLVLELILKRVGTPGA